MNKYDLKETTRRFHNIYEQVAKEYGYKTREDTKELDFNSPNGMTMLKTVETMTTPYLEEIERLNNIINELEKYLIEEIEDYEKQIKHHKKNKDLRSGILDLVGEYEGEKVCFEDTLEKLQELKGSDKE